jgi:glyoxylase-like metal-dependent hydrolase (beta-lactamase superfamily II)
MDDMKSPGRLGPMRVVNRPRLDENETAFKQIQKRGYKPGDVRHIIMTHLDLDHTGGLPDFPKAKIHVLLRELEAAITPRSFKEKERYRNAHWAHSPEWVAYEDDYNKETWFGFDSIRWLKGLPPEIVLVRLPGHTRGHCGVAIRTADRWLLHAGDSYYFHKQMDENSKVTPMVRLFQCFAHLDYDSAMLTKELLRVFVSQSRRYLTVICSHDTEEFEELSLTKVK